MPVIKTIAMMCVLGVALLAAENPFLGTWKLNVDKSNFGPRMEVKSLTVTFKLEDLKIRRIAEGTDGHDKPIMQGGPAGTLFAWDGKQHRVSPDGEPVVTVAANPVVHGTTDVTMRMQGKVFARVHAAVADDGKTLTETQQTANDKGQFIKSVLVFEKQ